jgi:hypothetical protein
LFCLWVIAGIRFIAGFYEDVVLIEFAGRFHERIHRSQPLLFYRNNRDALAKFGREVRRIAAEEHLRYEILPARDEGLLLYLRRPRFFRELPLGCDALVVPLDEEPWSSDRFSYRVTVEKTGDEPSSYGFVAPLPPHR